MTITAHFKMALSSLKNNKIRTILTVLGIIIGVASVTTIVSLGEGVKHQFNEQAQQLGSDIATITPGRDTNQLNPLQSLGGNQTSTSAQLSEKDLNLVQGHDNVLAASGLTRLDGTVSTDKQKVNSQILGVTQNYLEVNGQKIQSGQFFSDDISNSQTVVLTNDLAQKLFNSDDPLGSSIQIRGERFVVIGVLHPRSGFNFGQHISNMAIIPIDSAWQLAGSSNGLQQINIKFEKLADVLVTSKSIEDGLKELRAGEEDFTITTQAEVRSRTDTIFRTLTGFTAAVASISLLVGGIGVMNIMFVTVTERTKEIGIRKAIGATRTQIMTQFLTEALLITTVGGVIGILSSIALGYAIGSKFNITPSFDLKILGVAALTSLVVGLLFGTWPALRAARKKPTTSLKHE